MRIPPITHSALDRTGFAHMLIAAARRTGIAGYVGDGANRWPTGHALDVARLFRLALENAPAGTRWHAVGEDGIAMREIAQSIGDHLGITTASIPADQLPAHFGPVAMLVGLDNPTSNLITRQTLGWEPVRPGLFADFDSCDYFKELRWGTRAARSPRPRAPARVDGPGDPAGHGVVICAIA